MERFLSTAVTAVVLTVLTVAALNYYGITCTGSASADLGPANGLLGGHGPEADHQHRPDDG